MAKEPPYDDLWYSSPVQVFEEARDAASDAIDVATTLIQLAQQYRDEDPNTTLSAICRNHKTVVGEDYSDLLSNAIHRCQSLLGNTPIKRFLEQYAKPISLETLQPDAKGRCTASSYHDLALADPPWLRSVFLAWKALSELRAQYQHLPTGARRHFRPPGLCPC